MGKGAGKGAGSGGFCCGGNDDIRKEAIVDPKDRKCRDVLFCILFLAFLVGMAVVGGVAFSRGIPERIIYGIDKHGFQCGYDNSGDNPQNATNANFEDRKQLYYVDPFELFADDTYAYRYAKTVCVNGCPGETDGSSDRMTCDITNGTLCSDPKQYVCQYYSEALVNNEVAIDGQIATISEPYDVTYYDKLVDINAAFDCSAVADLMGKVPDFIAAAADLDTCGKQLQISSFYPSFGPCHAVVAKTTNIYNRCFPEINEELSSVILQTGASALGKLDAEAVKNKLSDGLDGAADRLDRYISDLEKGWLIVLLGGLVAGIVLSLIWMIILRYFAGLMAWATIIIINVGMLGITLCAFNKAGYLGNWGTVGEYISTGLSAATDSFDPSDSDRKIWLGFAIIATVATLAIFLFTLLMISRVRIAIATIKVASQAVGHIPSVLIFPILPFIMYACFISYWIFVGAYLYSSGDIAEERRESEVTGYSVSGIWNSDADTVAVTTPTVDTDTPCGISPNCRYTVTWNKELKYMMLYHLFGLLWVNQWIVGFTYVCIAGAIAQYYWNRGKTDQMPKHPVVTATKNAIWYHTGTIALGALIVAIIQFIRIILEYIDRKTKKAQDKNVALKWCMCCIKYCMWYLEKLMKFINRNAYIIVAIKGTGYCTSALRAVKLIVNNVLRLAAVNIIGDALIFLGKLCITAGCGIIAFLLSSTDMYTNPEKSTYLSSPLLPIIIACLVAYIVASIFFAVYEMAIDTILLCFCEDCESHNGVAQYAPPKLAETLGKAGERAAKEREAKEQAAQFEAK